MLRTPDPGRHCGALPLHSALGWIIAAFQALSDTMKVCTFRVRLFAEEHLDRFHEVGFADRLRFAISQVFDLPDTGGEFV
ncbi:MAG: hypothetical protein JWP89_1101 [Schlesneria sp.]|nr:hypothetical protein [Schlesneria sp.]